MAFKFFFSHITDVYDRSIFRIVFSLPLANLDFSSAPDSAGAHAQEANASPHNKKTNIQTTAEPLISDHLKYEDLVVAFENRPTGDLFRKVVRTCLLENILHAISTLCHVWYQVVRQSSS